MAQEEKQLVLSIDFQTDEAIERAAMLRSSIDADKEALNELNKTIKKNGELSLEQLKQREQLEQAIRQNTKSRNDEIRALDAYIKATKAGFDANGKWNGSIKEMRAAQAVLTEQWNNLTREQRENAEQGGVLRKQLKMLSDEIKENGAAIGDNRMNVGGYLDAIRQAPGAMGKFRAGVDGISTAVKASPMGWLQTVLQFLPKLFGESSEGAGLFGKTMDQISAITNVLLDRIKFVGEAAEKLFAGDFQGASEAARKSFKGIGDEMAREVRLTGDLADARKLLERDEAKNIATSKRLLNEVERLKNIRDNEFNSIPVRNKANEDAFKKEMERQEKLEDLARRRVAIVQKEIEMRGGATKATTEQLRALGEAEEALYDILEDSAGKQNELITNRYQLEQERLQKIKEAREEEKRLQKEREDAYLKQRDLARKELEDFNKFMEDLKKAKDKEVEDEKKRREERFNSQVAQMQKSSALLKEETEQIKREAAERKRISDEEIAQKEREYQAMAALAEGGQALFAALAQENSAFAEFEKAMTLFKIGLASAEALTKGISASQALPFPGNLIAMGTTIATVTANLLQAKSLIEGDVPKPPQKAAEGGLLAGPSHADGGIRGTGSFANVEVEGGEAIINKRSTAMFAGILNAINLAGGGKPLGPSTYAAAGGYLSPAAMAPLNGAKYMTQTQPVIDYGELAKAMAAQPVYTIPTEIVSKANQTNARKTSTRIG